MIFEQEKLISQVAELAENQQKMEAVIEALTIENKLLRQKVQALLKRMFGTKSEKLNPNQLELLLGFAEELTPAPEDDDTPPSAPSRSRKSRKSKPRLPENLPTETITIDPDEVNADPKSYKCIGEEVTEELDVIPQQYFRRLIIRRKYKSINDRSLPPIIAPLAPRVVDGGYATPGLLTDIVLKKYEDHLPLYRQERIIRSRFGIELSRKTMSDWIGVTANWLKPIYNLMKSELKQSKYLQIDETPVRYPDKDTGSRLGYFWLYNHPGGDVIYEWHTGRSTQCLEEILDGFSGAVQCDGYISYISYANSHSNIELAGCWAHARRKFTDAISEEPKLAAWFINQIGALYHIESQLRDNTAGPRLRCAIREAQSQMIINRIKTALDLKYRSHLPQGMMGKAIGYALRHWSQLEYYIHNGLIEIDNNLIENAVRSLALGKKNWLCIGHAEAGERSAIIYSILETCKRYNINTQEYLRDVLTRLPSMKITEVSELIPKNWIATHKKNNALKKIVA